MAGIPLPRVIRLTLIKGLNDSEAAIPDYAALIERSEADFIEVKSYMALGFRGNGSGPTICFPMRRCGRLPANSRQHPGAIRWRMRPGYQDTPPQEGGFGLPETSSGAPEKRTGAEGQENNHYCLFLNTSNHIIMYEHADCQEARPQCHCRRIRILGVLVRPSHARARAPLLRLRPPESRSLARAYIAVARTPM